MIGLFDSGHGGLTIYQALTQRFPDLNFLYLGDHKHAPYGNRPSQEILSLTQKGVDTLFKQGCTLVLLACNTATAIAARKLQQDWLPRSKWQDRNILGIIAPTVEAATQTPWAVKTPQYPQKNNDDLIVLFATTRTITSEVYPEEIAKRCPKVKLIAQDCPNLVNAIENGVKEDEIDQMVREYVETALKNITSQTPHRAILGCTHYPLVRHLFEKHLPQQTRLFCQPTIVADSLEDYLDRHPRYRQNQSNPKLEHTLLTTGHHIYLPKTLTQATSNTLLFQHVTY